MERPPMPRRSRARRATLGVVVAGGRGTRLGAPTPKALVRFAGATLLDRAIALARETCDTIVVVAPADFELPIPAGVRVDDPRPGMGPLGGMVAGLRARAHARAIVLAVDLPLLGAPLLEALLAGLEGRSAAVPAPAGMPQPLAAAYAADAVATLERRLAAGERSVVAAVRTLDPWFAGDEELDRIPGGAAQLLNVNTAADLEAAERALAARVMEDA